MLAQWREGVGKCSLGRWQENLTPIRARWSGRCHSVWAATWQESSVESTTLSQKPDRGTPRWQVEVPGEFACHVDGRAHQIL